MKKVNKFLILATSSLIISPLFLIDIIQKNQANNHLTNFHQKENIAINPSNRYLMPLNFKSGIRYQETSANLNYSQKIDLFDFPDNEGANKNKIAINIQELNKYNVSTKEFIESLKFNFNGGFIEFNSGNSNNKIIFSKFNFSNRPAKPNMVGNATTPFLSFDFPNTSQENQITTFPDQEFDIVNYNILNKYISLAIQANYNPDTGILYIHPQIKVYNDGISDNNLFFNISPNQNTILSIESPFIWEDDNIVIDQYISSEFRLSAPLDAITISSESGQINDYSFVNSYLPAKNIKNATDGKIINKNGDNQNIFLDLSNIYYDNNINKSFKIILNNFKLEEYFYDPDKIALDWFAETNSSQAKDQPIVFDFTIDNTLANGSEIDLSYSFFPFLNEATQGSLKMKMTLQKVNNLKYIIQRIAFTHVAGSEGAVQQIKMAFEPNDFISVNVLPADFSASKGLQEIKTINKTRATIASSNSSDVFNDSNYVDNNGNPVLSNFAKVKANLDTKLLELFQTPTFQAMGASLATFNYPVYSSEYLNLNDYTRGYGILRIAAKTPNRFIERIELKILYDVNKTGTDEIAQVSLSKNSANNKTLIALESEKYNDMNQFIADLNAKSNFDKLSFFDVSTNGEDVKDSVINTQTIRFGAVSQSGLKQDGQLAISFELNPHYFVLNPLNNKLENIFTTIVRDLRPKYPTVEKSDITIESEKIAQKAQQFSSFATFLASEGSKVNDYILTKDKSQIIEQSFIINPPINTIQIKIKITDSFVFDNGTQEKIFEIGNIYYQGETIPTLKEVDFEFNYLNLARYAKGRENIEQFIREFNQNWATLLSGETSILNNLTETEKVGIESMKIQKPNGRSLEIVIKLKSGYQYLEQDIYNLSKTFKVINITFLHEEQPIFNPISVEVNARNLIDYIKDYTDLTSFISAYQDKFLIPNDNINAILKLVPYYADTVYKTKVYLNRNQSIIIDLQTISGYYFNANDINNPNQQIIITIEDIKNYYNDLNDNANSRQILVDLYFHLLKNDAKKYNNIDEFINFLNTNNNYWNYLNIQLGNINSITSVQVERNQNSSNSANFIINLKEGYHFLNTNLTQAIINIGNLSFNGQDLNLTAINLELDDTKFAAAARKFLDFTTFNASLTTLEEKLIFFTFTLGEKIAIKNINLTSGLEDPNTINLEITLNDGFYFSDLDFNQMSKTIVVNNIYYQNDTVPDPQAVGVSIDGNALLTYVSNFVNFKSMALVLNKETELLKFIKFNDPTSAQALKKIFIYKSKYWNDFYIQVELKNNYYFEGLSQNKSYQSFLISNVRYSGDETEELQDIKLNFNYDFFFELLLNYDLNNFANFSKENYQYLFNFENNKSIIQILPLDSRVVQSAKMYHDSTGFIFELKFVDGYYWDQNNKWNGFYRKNISYDNLKAEHNNYLERVAINAQSKNNLILIVSLTTSFTLVAIIGIVVIVKVSKSRKAKRMKGDL